MKRTGITYHDSKIGVLDVSHLRKNGLLNNSSGKFEIDVGFKIIVSVKKTFA